VGVGHNEHSLAVGVAQLIASAKFLGTFFLLLPLFGASGQVSGVGQLTKNEDSFSLVWRSDFSR